MLCNEPALSYIESPGVYLEDFFFYSLGGRKMEEALSVFYGICLIIIIHLLFGGKSMKRVKEKQKLIQARREKRASQEDFDIF